MASLTDYEARILRYVTDFAERRGRFPSGPHIARELGYKHPSSVYHHLQALAHKGYLDCERRASGHRRYALTRAARVWHRSAYPVLGAIPAGPLTDLDAYVDDVIETLEDLVPGLRPGDFFLRVNGDSMKDAGLPHGTLIALRPTPDIPFPGAVCAVWVWGEGSTLKHLYPEGPRVRLVPNNRDDPAYVPQTFPRDQVTVQAALVQAFPAAALAA